MLEHSIALKPDLLREMAGADAQEQSESDRLHRHAPLRLSINGLLAHQQPPRSPARGCYAGPDDEIEVIGIESEPAGICDGRATAAERFDSPRCIDQLIKRMEYERQDEWNDEQCSVRLHD
jgi:hypothetical protein